MRVTLIVLRHTSPRAACISCPCCVPAEPAWRRERIRRDVVDVVLNPRVFHFCRCLSLCGGEGDSHAWPRFGSMTLLRILDELLFYVYRLHFKGTGGKQLYWLFSPPGLDNFAEAKVTQHSGYHHVTYTRCIVPNVLIIQCRGKVAIRCFFFHYFFSIERL